MLVAQTALMWLSTSEANGNKHSINSVMQHSVLDRPVAIALVFWTRSSLHTTSLRSQQLLHLYPTSLVRVLPSLHRRQYVRTSFRNSAVETNSATIENALPAEAKAGRSRGDKEEDNGRQMMRVGSWRSHIK
ncbi:hypothetical protein C8J56DRAFT_977015 [Mycena floridula]|nr:hypothetical protein C8J56DRAFT_977015 [Mycena floridula]